MPSPAQYLKAHSEFLKKEKAAAPYRAQALRDDEAPSQAAWEKWLIGAEAALEPRERRLMADRASREREWLARQLDLVPPPDVLQATDLRVLQVALRYGYWHDLQTWLERCVPHEPADGDCVGMLLAMAADCGMPEYLPAPNKKALQEQPGSGITLPFDQRSWLALWSGPLSVGGRVSSAGRRLLALPDTELVDQVWLASALQDYGSHEWPKGTIIYETRRYAQLIQFLHEHAPQRLLLGLKRFLQPYFAEDWLALIAPGLARSTHPKIASVCITALVAQRQLIILSHLYSQEPDRFRAPLLEAGEAMFAASQDPIEWLKDNGYYANSERRCTACVQALVPLLYHEPPSLAQRLATWSSAWYVDSGALFTSVQRYWGAESAGVIQQAVKSAGKAPRGVAVPALAPLLKPAKPPATRASIADLLSSAGWKKTDLDSALTDQARWTPAAWRSLEKHPRWPGLLLGLLWGVYDGQGALQRVLCVDRAGLTCSLDAQGVLLASPLKGGQISFGLLHPLELSDASRTAWRSYFSAQKIKSVIEQVDRPLAPPDPAGGNALCSNAVRGATGVALDFKTALQRRGWAIATTDDRWVRALYRRYPAADIDVFLNVEGLATNSSKADRITLDHLWFVRSGDVRLGKNIYGEAKTHLSKNDDADWRLMPLKMVPPLVYNETMLALHEGIAAMAVKKKKPSTGGKAKSKSKKR